MSDEDRSIVTCLDASGRWRLARITPSLVIGKSDNENASGVGATPASQSPAPVIGNSNNREGAELRVEFLEDAARGFVTPLDSGVVTGGFTDWHVHLHLVDWAVLGGSPITRVHDLGGDPAPLSLIANNVTQGGGPVQPFDLMHAGAFLTAPGGYPSDRSWAPHTSYREVANEAQARHAVREMVIYGASAIKVASNRDAGPVFSDEVFRAIVEAARTAGLPVVAHAEGPGEALRAARLGATRLAHAPFSERLRDDEVAELAASTEWCSTLDIHGWGERTPEHGIAVANVKAFVRLGGRLLYGTDMGNGPTPIGLNPREVASLAEAGLTPEQQLTALTPGDPLHPNATLLWVPRDDRGELDVAGARPLTAADLHRA